MSLVAIIKRNMEFDFSPIRNWFGYSRRERRSSVILLILIVLVISARFFVPGKNIPVEVMSLVQDEGISASQDYAGQYGNNRTITQKAVVSKKALPEIDLNKCDTSELIRLPGIGPVLSVRIIKYRSLLGGYYSREQLREVYGLPIETYEKIKDRLTVDTLLISEIEINKADYRRLSRMPYFEKSDVNAILKFRELNGTIESISELIENKVLTKERAQKVRPYLNFD